MCMECMNGAQTAVQAATLMGGPVVYSYWHRIKVALRLDLPTYNEVHGIDAVEGCTCCTPVRPCSEHLARSA